MVEAGLEGLHPQGVSLFAQMEPVGHDIEWDGAVGVEEGLVDVEVENGFSIRQRGEEGVDLLVELQELVAGAIGAGEDGKENDFGVWQLGAELIHDEANAVGRDLRRVLAVAGVVGADENNDGFRGDAIDLAVAQAPEDILGFVGAVAKVENGFSRESLGDDFGGTGIFEGLSDRVSKEDKVDVGAFFGDLAEFFGVAGFPVFASLRNRREGGGQWIGQGRGLPKGDG